MKIPSKISFLMLAASCFALVNCGHQSERYDISYRDKGSITLSRSVSSAEKVGKKIANSNPEDSPVVFGYVPPAEDFLPAMNEKWLEIDSKKGVLKVIEGDKVVYEAKGSGKMSLNTGSYSLSHRQDGPVWYAPDSYYISREMLIPDENSEERYLRGALGQLAIYPTPAFPIHSSAIWSKEVGGFKVAHNSLEKISDLLELGSKIVVK